MKASPNLKNNALMMPNYFLENKQQPNQSPLSSYAPGIAIVDAEEKAQSIFKTILYLKSTEKVWARKAW